MVKHFASLKLFLHLVYQYNEKIIILAMRSSGMEFSSVCKKKLRICCYHKTFIRQERIVEATLNFLPKTKILNLVRCLVTRWSL